MWSLPNIAQMNARASTTETQDRIKHLINNPSEEECAHCGGPCASV
jgi:hypothetical protein